MSDFWEREYDQERAAHLEHIRELGTLDARLEFAQERVALLKRSLDSAVLLVYPKDLSAAVDVIRVQHRDSDGREYGRADIENALTHWLKAIVADLVERGPEYVGACSMRIKAPELPEHSTLPAAKAGPEIEPALAEFIAGERETDLKNEYREKLQSQQELPK